MVALVVGIDFGVAFSLAPSRMGKKYPRSCFGKVVNGDGEFSRCCIMKPLGARLSKIWSRIYWLLPYFVATLWFCVILPLAVIGVKFDTQSTRRREIWFGVALAPPGVWLRYLLSRYNVRPKSRVLWLPVGTFLANAIASAAMAALSTTQALVRLGLTHFLHAGTLLYLDE